MKKNKKIEKKKPVVLAPSVNIPSPELLSSRQDRKEPLQTLKDTLHLGYLHMKVAMVPIPEDLPAEDRLVLQASRMTPSLRASFLHGEVVATAKAMRRANQITQEDYERVMRAVHEIYGTFAP